VYAELGAMMPRAGGEYVYLSRAFHPKVGFLSGWVSLWVGFSAPIAAAAMAAANYARVVLPGLPVRFGAAALIVLLSLLHMASVTWGARAQTFFTVLKVALVGLFVCAALTIGRGSWSHFSLLPSAPRPSSLAVAVVLTAFAYSGWNAAAYLAGELRAPGRTLPRALLFGTGLVTLLYLGLNVAFFFALPPAALGAKPEIVAEVAASALFGERVSGALAACIALALVSSVSAMVMAGPRVYLAMADDGLFFRSAKRRTRGGAPAFSIGLQGALAVGLAVTTTFEGLITYAGFTLSAFAALTVVGAAVLRVHEPFALRPYRAFAWPLPAVCFLAVALWSVAFSIAERPLAALGGALTIVSGLVAYSLWSGAVRGRGAGARRSSAPRARRRADSDARLSRG
jgi:APA family basic amino acid/polyamine antiporter